MPGTPKTPRPRFLGAAALTVLWLHPPAPGRYGDRLEMAGVEPASEMQNAAAPGNSGAAAQCGGDGGSTHLDWFSRCLGLLRPQ